VRGRVNRCHISKKAEPMWNFLEAILDIIWQLFHWRFSLCTTVGFVLAFVAVATITISPLQWIVAGTAIIASVVIGLRWESSSKH
jgi:hypothetical protein